MVVNKAKGKFTQIIRMFLALFLLKIMPLWVGTESLVNSDINDENLKITDCPREWTYGRQALFLWPVTLTGSWRLALSA